MSSPTLQGALKAMAIPNATAEQHGADLHTMFHKGDSIECPD
eukprot:COSAG06_NODE_24903_length_649_cov_2.150909_2_plen_41_part_01